MGGKGWRVGKVGSKDQWRVDQRQGYGGGFGIAVLALLIYDTNNNYYIDAVY
jgi:hypothetical protein